LRAADEALAVAVAENGAITYLQRGFEDSMVLALAWLFTGGASYVERGSDMLERLFVDPGARVDPRRPGLDAGAGLLGAGEKLYYYLDAVRVFERAGSVGQATREGLRAWLAARLEWLSTSPEGRAERAAGDHCGTSHDLQVASIAAFLDDHALVYEALVRAQARIRGQFCFGGRQHREPAGASAMHWRCYNLQTWIHLAELGSRWGVDLWGYRAPDGTTLAQGAQWLLASGQGLQPLEQGGAFDVERLQPIRFAAREWVDLGSAETESTPYGAKPLFPPNCGIRPFWNLASYGPSSH
jgi:alginate lyase